MENIIRKKLKEIEEENHVRILLALESGSRAWGFGSAVSDYDVRFIYIHPPEWYLSIDPQGVGSKKDVIAYPQKGNLDISGWEITKALRLFRKSNPTILEWLRSSPIYSHNHSFVKQLRRLENDVFNSIPIMHHYYKLAIGNYAKSFKGEEVKIKIFLYVLKSLLSCIWIGKYKSFPPVRIQELLPLIDDGQVKMDIEHLVRKKVLGEDMVTLLDYQDTQQFLETQFLFIQQLLSSQKKEQTIATSQLDQLFRDTLSTVWTLK
ncbi:nucleotidyltransferase domain-containing protein [Ureibacillus sinduriensis]|uniref:Nucleotidyltransferase n=1 Tax=Ureibacillus sinduriensis BLB-1 = JCM 15800 TaxID=1384057 RepID=A0A0A3HVZ5_9BACL|nr:nucleotidyltransferase domain-containing protein [Ureibacillus sinduriensis]KGR75375.1 hypothetical protein CD33_11670 [Ureibacillus sinduriensis BLB-1 = JCM 15800]